MSRIGTKTIEIPSGLTVKSDGDQLHISFGGNSQTVKIHRQVGIVIEGNVLKVTRKGNDKLSRSLHGLTRALIFNSIKGLTQGYQKDLEIVGVGYRANLEGNKLILKLGYSHDTEFTAPEGITFEVKKNIISVKGFDKQLVGQVAAEIRSAKKPEPYKGKGIKYVGEKVLRKVGKALKSTTPGA